MKQIDISNSESMSYMIEFVNGVCKRNNVIDIQYRTTNINEKLNHTVMIIYEE